LRPYQIDTTGPRRFAVVANIGGGGRDIDTISLINLAEETPRVVDTVAAGLTPEGVKMSPDGEYVAVNVNNGSNANPGSSLYHPTGLLQIWRVAQGHLGRVVEAPIGGWGQGIAWSRDAHMLLVQSMIAKDIEVFEFDGQHLRQTGRLPMPAGPAAIATVEP
jgi:DNA-binding beta-propeller fold protein YncE